VLVDRSGVLAGKVVVTVAARSRHCLALCADGTLAAWGENPYGELGDGSTTNRSVPVLVNQTGVLAGKTVTALAAGFSHTLALCADGSMAGWGHNNYGQLGDNSTTNRSVPVLVNQTGALSGKTITALAAGASHTVALCADGSLAAWGYNNYSQLGDATTTSRSVPVAVTKSGVLAGKAVRALAAGSAHNLVLGADGTIATWGYNVYGQ
jgi:alpha-tubulin suppressor-like RCC1 family protein